MSTAAEGIRQAYQTLSSAARELLTVKSKVGWWVTVSWFVYAIFLVEYHQSSRPVSLLVAFFCSIILCRSWLARRSAVLILRRDAPGRLYSIYYRALWSYAWRSFITFSAISLFTIVGFIDRSPEEAGRGVGVVMAVWLLSSMLVLDVPFWGWRKAKSLSSPEQKSGGGLSEAASHAKLSKGVAVAVCALVTVGASIIAATNTVEKEGKPKNSKDLSGPRPVFVGTPTVRVFASGAEAKTVLLSVPEQREYLCRIVEVNGKYLWTSRESLCLLCRKEWKRIG